MMKAKGSATTKVQNASFNKQTHAKIKGPQKAAKRGDGVTAKVNDGKRTRRRPTGKNLEIIDPRHDEH